MPRIRLRRSDPSRPGLTRRRYGRGFRYIDADGAPVTDPAVLERIRALAIPPAWRDVWICPDERGHIQAIGTDAAGRRQYRYHDAWRETRDAAKHDRVLEVAQRLPALRKTVERHLARPTLDRERVLATAVRLLDLGMFRIGSESYAEQNGTYGLATLRREHVCLRRGRIAFCYPAKSGQQRVVEIEDAKVRPVLAALRRIQHDGDELLAYRCGRQWCDVRSNEINDYLKEVSGGVEITAKDFRTWHATVLMAVHLALGPPAETERARRKVVRAALEEVAHYLGNTPAVAEASYVDPRIVT
ncbi:MAG TPA: DNA topoisomerase IB, partial [Cryptosporangiaceae bacterium]|nr:DNA topoisomerase IB [Cryptosporangiaceae bacterium]